jgi:tight adherence protein C
MNPTLATGAVLGLCAGVGVLLVLGWSPWLRRPGLEQRLAPYVRDALPRSGLLRDPTVGSPGLLGTVERLLAPVMADARSESRNAIDSAAS